MPVLDTTVPYPWPYDACLDGARLALVVAGAQKAWTARSSRVDEVRTALALAARAVRTCGGTVVVVRHSAPNRARDHRPLPPRAGDDGWALDVAVHECDVVVDAVGVDGFHGSPLDAILRARGIDHVVLGGFGYEATVDSTMRSANDRGYECLVLRDAVAPFDDMLGARALSSCTMSGGIFGAVGSTAALVAALYAENLEAVP